MGAGTEVTRKKSNRNRVSTRLTIDLPLLIAVIILIAIGFLALYSASWHFSLQEYDSGTEVLQRQMGWILIGLIFCCGITMIDYHKFKGLSIIGITVVSVLLAIVNSRAGDASGYTRSLFNNGSVQLTEPAKPLLICFLATQLLPIQQMSNEKKSLKKMNLFPAIIVTLLLAVLAIFQPDFSTAIIVVLLAVIMFFFAGGPIHLVILAFLLLIILGFLGYLLMPDKIGVRIEDWIHGLANSNEASYHIQRSFYAILSGGLWGVGFGKGTAKLTGLPVAWTDSIFAVIIEETGLIGGSVIIFLYIFIFWRGYTIFKRAADPFGRLLAGGISLWIYLEALVNIMVMICLMPFAGNALPLISYGGSNAISILGGIGCLMSVSRFSAKKRFEEERKNPDALINLRRWDGRWGVSRLGSPTGNE